MTNGDEDSLEVNVKVIESQMKAKKAILHEVLGTLENEKDKERSSKRRNYIRDILKCEVSHKSVENNIFSIDFIESFRFENYVISRFKISKLSQNRDLSVRVFSCSSDCSIRWILFENGISVNTFSALSSKSAVLCLAVPFSAFFHHDRIPVSIECQLVNGSSQLFNPAVQSAIGIYLTSDAWPVASTNRHITFSEATEELELKSIEFMDETKAVRIIQSLFTVYYCLEIQKSPDFSDFRRTFPGFLENDFDVWRLFVGSEQFDGILVYTQSEENTAKSFVLAKTSLMCRKFMEVMKKKHF